MRPARLIVETRLRGPARSFGGRLAAGSVLLAALLAACAPNAPLDYLNRPVGETAVQADRLWDLVFVIAVIVFVLVEGALVYALIRFRDRPGRRAAQFHGNTKLEVVLTLIPALLLAGIAIPTIRTLVDIAADRPDSVVVKVVGRQFWFEYEYEDSGIVTANELHIPTGIPVRLRIEGDPNDVIHSFWVPRIAGKQDVVPGRTNYLNLEAPEPGTYLGQCTEFCGLSHANMRLRVIAHEPDDFEDWLADQAEPARPPTAADAVRGQKLFLEGACVTCHTIAGTEAAARVGPDLTHFASRATFAGSMFENTTENLRAWLADPPGVKPGAKMPDLGLTAEEIDDLVAYLQTLE